MLHEESTHLEARWADEASDPSGDCRQSAIRHSYIGPDLGRHVGRTTFTDKADAETWLTDERRLLESGEWCPPAQRRSEAAQETDSETLSQYAKRWLTHRRVKGEPLRPSTVIDYERALRLYINPHLGGLRLPDITRTHVRNWYNQQLLDVKDRSKAKAYSVLRTIMNSAAEDELITVNPVSIRGAGVARRKHNIEPATVKELDTIVNTMPARLRLLVELVSRVISSLTVWDDGSCHHQLWS